MKTLVAFFPKFFHGIYTMKGKGKEYFESQLPDKTILDSNGKIQKVQGLGFDTLPLKGIR